VMGSDDTTNILNLFKPLARCNWDELHHQISKLSSNRELLLPTLSATDSNDLSTPIHVAVWKAPPALALWLLQLLDDSEETKSLLLARDAEGNTALHLCAANLQPSIDALSNVEHQFDISVLQALCSKTPSSGCVAQNSRSDTPLHLLISTPYPDPLLEQAERDKSLLNAVVTLMKRNPSACLLKDSSGATPLHVCIANSSSYDLISTVLEKCKDATSIEDKYGMLPLHYVAAFAKTPVEVVLKIFQAHPPAVYSPTGNGDVPLHLAISNSNTTLIKKGQINKESLKIVRALVQTHTDEENSPLLKLNKEKLGPLHCCALFDAPPQLTKLIMKHPLGTKASSMVNSFGATPLHLAAAQPGVAVSVSSILALGTPEAASVQDRLKRTPLHVASQNIHSTGLLIKSLIQLNPKAVRSCSSKGNLPLHLVTAQSQAKIQVIKELIKAYPHGTSIRNKKGNTPLHVAAKSKSSPPVIEMLLEANPAVISVVNSHLNLPLHCATAYDASFEVVLLLLKQYPEACLEQNESKETPLHYSACNANQKEILEIMVQIAPESLNIMNSSNQTPLQKARAQKGELLKENIAVLKKITNE